MHSNLTFEERAAMAEQHAGRERVERWGATFFQSLDERLARHEVEGFVPLHNAAVELAARYPGEDEEDSRKTFYLLMCEAWANGKLPVYSEGTRLAIEAPDAEDRKRLKGWERFGPGGMRKHLDPNRAVDGLDLVKVSDLDSWLQLSGRTFSEPKPVLSASADLATPVPRQRAQEDVVLNAIKKLGYDPLALPRNPSGKPGPKAAVRAALSQDQLFKEWSTVFDHAWERLRADGSIVDQP